MPYTREEQKCQAEPKAGEMKEQRREGERRGTRPEPRRTDGPTDRRTEKAPRCWHEPRACWEEGKPPRAGLSRGLLSL